MKLWYNFDETLIKELSAGTPFLQQNKIKQTPQATHFHRIRDKIKQKKQLSKSNLGTVSISGAYVKVAEDS